MKNYTALRTALVALAATSAVFLSAKPAHAFGYMGDIAQARGRGHLVFITPRTHKINFCVTIDNSVASRFSQTSIESQTQAALKLWINALLTNRLISISKVSCLSSDLNLMVVVGPNIEKPQFPEIQEVINEPGRSYSRIILNSDLRYELRGELHAVTDFGALATKFVNPVTAEQLISATFEDPAANMKVIEQMFYLDPSEIIASSYSLLIHGIGHSFGLCDTASAEIVETCKLDTLTVPANNEQPDSVMKSNGDLRLYDDDIRGINALYGTYGPAYSEAKGATSSPRK